MEGSSFKSGLGESGVKKTSCNHWPSHHSSTPPPPTLLPSTISNIPQSGSSPHQGRSADDVIMEFGLKCTCQSPSCGGAAPGRLVRQARDLSGARAPDSKFQTETETGDAGNCNAKPSLAGLVPQQSSWFHRGAAFGLLVCQSPSRSCLLAWTYPLRHARPQTTYRPRSWECIMS